jgi:hypothetical protein
MDSLRLAAIAERRICNSRLGEITRSTVKLRRVRTMLDVYRYALDVSRPPLLTLGVAQMRDANSHLGTLRAITLKYLMDRLSGGPLAVHDLVRLDPLMASSDAASIHRAIFEAAVNFLYLAQDTDDFSRFRSFHHNSLVLEQKIYLAECKWLNHADSYIAQRADAGASGPGALTDEQFAELAEPLTDASGRPPARHPSLLDRCVALGERWHFFYDCRYRGLSAWQTEIAREAL